MIDLLADADRSVSTIAENFEMSRPAVSQHLRVLLDAGLVTEQRHGRDTAATASFQNNSARSATGSHITSGSGTTASSVFRSSFPKKSKE